MRQLSVLIFFLLSVCLAWGEQIHDKSYKYKITLPDTWTVQHSGKEGFNLRAANADSTTTVTVFTMDAADIERDEFDDVENTKLSYREAFVDTLDRAAYYLPAAATEVRSNYVKRVERTYQLGDSVGIRTVIYFDEDIPHLIAVRSNDINSDEVNGIIESFSTPKMRLAGTAKWTLAGIFAFFALVLGIGIWIDNEKVLFTGMFLMVFIGILFICHDIMNFFYIPYWMA